ncbi:MAG: hypothetical protein EH224_11920 [Calditrichaeota bacterium]|nr:MAG: hypothetical protein EH224_11920 [Calditrichota bacterium]
MADGDRTNKGLLNDILDALQNIATNNIVNTSDSDMLAYSFASAKSQKQNGAGTITPVTNTTFYRIDFHNSTVITAMTVVGGWADYTGVTMPANSYILTNCTSIQISSGLITAYQRSTA